MKLFMFSIFDRASRIYDKPFCDISEASACRAVGNVVNSQDSSNQLHLHPDDFDLYNVGVYDDSTGQIEPRVPEMVCQVKSLVRKG